MYIREKVLQLRKKYDTLNPYEIAKRLGIVVIYEDLGSINGYYNLIYRQKQIHINQNLDKHNSKITLSHELGHAIIHPKANTPFLINNTYFSVDKLEMEANIFASHLLITDDKLLEYRGCTIEQLSMLLGYHKELIKLRLESDYI